VARQADIPAKAEDVPLFGLSANVGYVARDWVNARLAEHVLSGEAIEWYLVANVIAH
jgi:hypothetical protein